MKNTESLAESLDAEGSRSLRGAALRAVGAVLIPSLAMLLVYAIDAYFAWDFWTLAAFAALALLSFLLVRRGRLALGFGVLATDVLAYLGFETATVAGAPLELAFYLLTDYLGVAVLVIAAGLLAPAYAPLLTALAGSALFSALASLGSAAHLEATVFADLALLAAAVQVGAGRRLLGSFALRSRAAAQAEAREAELARARGAELEAALERNAALRAELNRRVQDKLQIVASLMSLQASDEPQSLPYLEPSRRRLEALALVYRMLRSGPEGDEVDFGAYAESLLGFCAAEFDGELPRLECRAEGFAVGLEAASSAGLMLAELAWNALEHGRPAEPPLRLGLVARPLGRDRFMFSVEDNGPGMVPASWPYPGAGLGLTLVAALAAQIGARVSYLPGGRGMAVEAPRGLPSEDGLGQGLSPGEPHFQAAAGL